MRLRALTLGELETIHRTRMGQDFPPEELKPFAAMQTLYEAGAYHPMGAWEGEDMVGYALLWESPRGTEGTSFWTTWGVEASRPQRRPGGRDPPPAPGGLPGPEGDSGGSPRPRRGDGRDALRQRADGLLYRRNGFAFLSYTCVLFGVHYGRGPVPPGRGGRGRGLSWRAHRQVYRAQLAPWGL